MKPNPLAKGILLLCLAWMLLGHAALALNADEWRHTQSVTVSQSGLVRADLPASTLDAAEPDLSDLRLLDPTGAEVSYLIERPMPQPESTSPPEDIQTAINPDSTTTVTLCPGFLTPIAAVRLVTPARHFIKAVKLESSSDGITWSEVAANRPIFRLPSGAENLRIDFPPAAYPWLRLTIDDRRDEPIPVTAASLISPRSAETPSVPVPIAIKSRDESPGITRLSLDLGGANLPIASLDIQTSSHLFTRPVSLAEPQMQDGVLSERQLAQPGQLAQSVIYRLDLGGTNEQRLTIPLERQVNSRELLLLIHNQDSPPLDIQAVTASRRPVRALFYATAPGAYTLLTGNSQCPAPSYDLSGLSAQLSDATSLMLTPDPLADNPSYRTPEALGTLSLQGAAIDPAKWKFRKSLPVTNPGAQQVEFDQDILAQASADFSDIRIIQAGHQIPYLIEHTSITRTIPLTATEKKDPDHPTLSRWQLKLPQSALPIDTLTCASPSPLFHRSIRLWEELSDDRGDTYSRDLGHADWSRTPAAPQPTLVLKLDTTPQANLIYLETDNRDNAPIELGAFKATYPVTRVIFKAAADPAQPIWLYYGNPEAASPSYDLRLIAADLLRAERQPITAAPQNPTDGVTAATSAALSGASRSIFWGVLALVVIVLLGVTAKLLPGAPSPPSADQ